MGRLRNVLGLFIEYGCEVMGRRVSGFKVDVLSIDNYFLWYYIEVYLYIFFLFIYFSFVLSLYVISIELYVVVWGKELDIGYFVEGLVIIFNFCLYGRLLKVIYFSYG